MEPILEVTGISKEYILGRHQKQAETFRELLQRKVAGTFRRNRSLTPDIHREHFWALRNVSFSVKEGEVVGIIGRNGAGKSTLLKIISRITDPTEGSITLRGRMASLLEVGTGFHPELTGRENIYMNGAILGMRKAEIDTEFDAIVDFAEIEQFLDTPVKHYSSGMYVRLAFAVAAHLHPEILIVDEVLAVGDVTFQKKCLGKMSDVSKSGRTVLFVSHNMAAVENLCQRGVVLERGRVVFDGTAKDGVHHYLSGISTATGTSGQSIDLSGAKDRRSQQAPLLRRLEFATSGDRPVSEGLAIGSPLKVRVHFDLQRPTASFNVGLGFDNIFGQRMFTAHSFFEPNRSHGDVVGPQVFVCDIPSLTLMPGDYLLRLWLDVNNSEADLINDAARITIVESDYYGTGKAPWNGAFVLRHSWYLDPVPQQGAVKQETTSVENKAASVSMTETR
jgi:lipopolysaccharide transport system ATP-binding protein